MRVGRLRLRDWRGFEHLDLPLHPRLTLLVGENGTGKTAVLEALALALDLTLSTVMIGGFRIPEENGRIGGERPQVEVDRGRDTNALYADLFGIDERPRETLERLNELGRRLDSGDVAGARKILDDLARDLGDSDPTVVEHRVALGLAGK